ncbi:hypothetical protein ACH47Z_14005 [Streptomyces sp. NPDC020192]|uniref:hypothetical protein n=1 Tax=Streptomyces sp. NPDC020192 TaxID=3365066 RepID=UPI00378ACD98
MKASASSTETWTVGDVRHSQGWVEVHYGRRNYGHYFWYYSGQGSNGFRIDTAVAWPDGSIKGNLYWATWKCK